MGYSRLGQPKTNLAKRVETNDRNFVRQSPRRTRPEGQRVFYGPFDPALSPDGRKLSYTYYYVSKGTAPGCTPQVWKPQRW